MSHAAGTPHLGSPLSCVDILIAAELMEAGRAILRGFVTPDRTTLIASTHRSLATAEKIVPGTGLADPAEVHRVAREQAREVIAFDTPEAVRANPQVQEAYLGSVLADQQAAGH